MGESPADHAIKGDWPWQSVDSLHKIIWTQTKEG